MKKRKLSIIVITMMVTIGLSGFLPSAVAGPGPPQPPQAPYCDAGGPYTGVANIVPINFDGTHWHPAGEEEESFKWTFGDGYYSYIPGPEHMYTTEYDGQALFEYWWGEMYDNDTAEVFIYTDNFELTLQIRHPFFIHRFLLGAEPEFIVRALAAGSPYEDTPPFTLVVEVRDRGTGILQETIYEQDFPSLREGDETAWQTTNTYDCNTIGEYEAVAKVFFPDTEIELGSPEDWWFDVYRLW
jgi:hypothetical protein